MEDWFRLVQEKNQLLRKENELMIQQRELQLQVSNTLPVIKIPVEQNAKFRRGTYQHLALNFGFEDFA